MLWGCRPVGAFLGRMAAAINAGKMAAIPGVAVIELQAQSLEGEDVMLGETCPS
jgi:hypothetical protein